MTAALIILLLSVSRILGCGLDNICRAGGFESTTVDPLSDIGAVARCSASSSSWYIQRYTNGNDSLDGSGAPLTLNTSFSQSGNELTIQNVSGFSEGTYHCGLSNNAIQPASLCLFVRGQPVFTSCPDALGACPSIMQINGTENGNVSIDTRIKFVNGGFCNKTKNIRILTVRNYQQVYLCSNLTTFSDQLCNSTEKFIVEQQQPCTGPDITLCKYDMKLILLNFGPSDEGLYTVELQFENDGRGRGMLMLQFNITLLNEMSNTGSNSFSPTSSTTSTISTAATTSSGELSGGAIAGIIIAPIIITIILYIIVIIVIVCIVCIMKKGQTRVESPNMLAVTDDDTIIVVGDSDTCGYVKFFKYNSELKKLEEIKSFNLTKGEKKVRPRGVATNGTHLFISDKANGSILKYTLDGDYIDAAGMKFSGCCGIAIDRVKKRVYIAHQGEHRIQVLDEDLKPLPEFDLENLKGPRDVAVDGNGNVYVSDTGNNCVRVFKDGKEIDGKCIKEIDGKYIMKERKFKKLAGLYVDRNDRIFVADQDSNRVCVFDSKGKLVYSFGEDAERNEIFRELISVVVDSDGRMYTSDHNPGHLKVFQLHG